MNAQSPLRRLAVGLLTLVGLCAAFIVTLAAPADAKVTTTGGASYWHPYSTPQWYPLRGSDATMDCASSNPGCGGKLHKDMSITWLSRTMQGTHPVYHRAPVYAAGAGILHVARNVGNRCENPETLGTWVWIDHGAGVVTRYGHLSSVNVPNNSYVTPDTIIGYTGHSGEHADCNNALNYLNFRIIHGGIWGHGVAQNRLLVCSGSKAVTWPNRLHGAWSSWQRVPQHSILPHGGTSATACVPHSWMSTPGLPTAHTSGHSASLHAYWNRPSSAYHVRYVYVLLEMYHPHNNTWSVESTRSLNGAPGDTWFHGLQHKKTYRTLVNFYNAAGWSRDSGWHSSKVS